MSYKKWSIINIFIILVISTILHFAYELIPNNIIASFAPVNESIFEHMKMIFNTFIIDSIIEYFVLKKISIFKVLTTSLSCILLTVILYYPFYYTFGDNFIYTMLSFIIAIIISQYISYKIHLFFIENKYMCYVSLVILLLLEFIFIYSTFNPKENELFIDHQNHKIGVFEYIEAPKEDI